MTQSDQHVRPNHSSHQGIDPTSNSLLRCTCGSNVSHLRRFRSVWYYILAAHVVLARPNVLLALCMSALPRYRHIVHTHLCTADPPPPDELTGTSQTRPSLLPRPRQKNRQGSIPGCRQEGSVNIKHECQIWPLPYIGVPIIHLARAFYRLH